MKKITILFLCSLSFYISASYTTKQEKIVICGVGKNIAHCLPNMIQKIENLGAHFKDYRVFIYENNSSDRSAQILNEWALKNEKVWVFCENVSYEELKTRVKTLALSDKAPCRMEMIAYARNIVLNEALNSNFDDFSFLMMTDLDFRSGWDINGVLASFNLNEPWDALTAHGVQGGSIHYDRYAYRDKDFPMGPELIGDNFWSDIVKRKVNLSHNSGLKKVYSAFGGMALYKRKAIADCVYSGYVTEDLTKLFDIIINHELAKNNLHYQWYKSIINTQENTLPIKFQRNSGYDGPVCCEHATFHATMILNGYDKIYVNPQMICRY